MSRTAYFTKSGRSFTLSGMHATVRTGCTWLGRCCLVGVVLVAVLALAYPAGLEPASPVFCPGDLTLAGGSGTGPKVVCTSPNRRVDATQRVLLLAGALFLGAVGFYSLRSRVTPPELRAPATPVTH